MDRVTGILDAHHITVANFKWVVGRLSERLWTSRFVVAITGAGISLASGLPLMSEKVDGLPLDEFFRSSFFENNPGRFYEVYREAVLQWRTAKPNPAHHALAERGVWVITQNIDGLHRDAGTNHLLELHGNLRELRCMECGQVFESSQSLHNPLPSCPTCKQILHPGISLEGQEVRHFSLAVDWVGRAEVLLVIGTKLDMDPIRNLPDVARQNGAEILWINESADELVPRLLDYNE